MKIYKSTSFPIAYDIHDDDKNSVLNHVLLKYERWCFEGEGWEERLCDPRAHDLVFVDAENSDLMKLGELGHQNKQ